MGDVIIGHGCARIIHDVHLVYWYKQAEKEDEAGSDSGDGGRQNLGGQGLRRITVRTDER